jgi:radical SAM protein with 4Fe4S-binding SPASM domain
MPKLLSIAIEPTNDCNLRCAHCYARESSREIGYMDWDFFRSIIDEAYNLGIIMVGLNYAGEPSLHPRFGDMIKYIADKGIAVRFNTNGIFGDELLETINDNVNMLTFSLDGTRESHELIRNSGSYDLIEANILKLVEMRGKKRTPRIRVAMSLSFQAEGEVEKFKQHWAGKGVMIYIAGYIKNMKWERLPVGWSLEPMEICGRFYRRSMAVLWDGSVTICCSDLGGEMRFGNVHDGIVNTFNSEHYNDLRKALLTNNWPAGSLCARCSLRVRIIRT